VEATGATTSVQYVLPSGTDAEGNPVPVDCNPPPGASQPLGVTPVTCSATDAAGQTSTAIFKFAVVDGTAPILSLPAALTVSSRGGATVSATRADVAAFLHGATAVDAVDGPVRVVAAAPAAFGIGRASVIFRAVDAAGNVATGLSTLTVVRGKAPFQPPVDRTPPGNVTHVGFAVGDRSVVLNWKLSSDRDADHVVVYRSLPDGSATVAIAALKDTQFTDRGLKNGRTYRYVIVEYDRVGNRSAGVAVIAVPHALALVRPPLGATVHRAPVLQWRSAPQASYYNVQLFRDQQKVFTSWPTRNRLALPASWVTGDIKDELRPGHYAWFVWPGFGRPADKRYGSLLGRSTFTVS
jgi:hypothetical protein